MTIMEKFTNPLLYFNFQCDTDISALNTSRYHISTLGMMHSFISYLYRGVIEKLLHQVISQTE